MLTGIEISGKKIGPGHPCFVIAEAGVNHNGDPGLARRLVEAAAAAGADAVKFQTFCAERLVSRRAPKAKYQLEHTDRGESQFEMLRRLELSIADHRALMDCCRANGVLFLSTPFDEQSADALEALGIAAFKISSGEVTNLPFLAHVARKQKPIILSTGMATLAEVEGAIAFVSHEGNRDLVLLHCVTNYPADPRDANLRAMHTMETAFGFPTGYSDHTPGIEVALAAVALGACVIEKHFTLDRNMPGPDHQASIEPGELRAMVAGIRRVEAALGDGIKRPVEAEIPNISVARKSLHWRRALPAGTRVAAGDVIALRPDVGLPPEMVPAVVGQTLTRAVEAGQPVSHEEFQRAP
jgi:N-acetylneuraminate synthase